MNRSPVDQSRSSSETPTEAPTRPVDPAESGGNVSRPAALPSENVGSEQGTYRLIEKLGEGGMGEVYAAEQLTPVRRRVALKIVKHGMDSRQVVARFEAERQALALMDHPNIAHIFDAGTIPSHGPFFAMELVTGRRVTRYCDEQRLTVEERIDVFLSVCAAVQHAHSKAVIHRDLKPSNILVTEQDGRAVPKIIDFGVAKAVTPPPGTQTPHTALGQIIGTPAYMSPEQADPSGLHVDTRTDVYSLGAVLYELLAGARPLEVNGGSQTFEEVLRTIRQDDPVRPSTRVSSEGAAEAAVARRTERRRWVRTLRGDLDWIVMKALEKDRERRYQSPAELAADLQRYREKRAVEARPPTIRYRLGKLVRRHRTIAVAAGATLLAVVAGLVGTSWQAVRATRAEREATREAARATSTNEFLLEMLAAANPRTNPRGADFTVREALDEAAARAGESFGERPAVRAAIQETMGASYLSLGAYEEAVVEFENALESRRIAGESEAEEAACLAQLGTSLAVLGRNDEAEPHLRRALEMRTALFGEGSAEVATSLNDLGVALIYAGRNPEAKPLLEQALSVRRARPDTPPEALMESTANLAAVLHYLGEYRAAEPLYRETLEQYRDFYGPDHPDVASLCDNLGVLLAQDGRPGEAVPLYEEALRIRRSTLGDHPLTANNLQNLGRAKQRAGDLDGAQELLLEALAMRRSLLDPGHPDISNSLDVLSSLSRLRGDLGQAEAYGREAVALSVDRLGPEHPSTAICRATLAGALRASGRWAEAAGQYEQALAVFEASNPGHWRPVMMRAGLAQCRLELGQVTTADSLFRAADAGAQVPGVSDDVRREILDGLVRTSGELGDADRTEELRNRLAGLAAP